MTMAPETLDRRLAFQTTPAMAQQIDDAASAKLMTTSAWLRAIVLAALEREGSDALPRLVGHMKHRDGRETAAAA
jgi:hypothetical protein